MVRGQRDLGYVRALSQVRMLKFNWPCVSVPTVACPVSFAHDVRAAIRSLTSRSLEQRRDELAVFLPEGQALADRRALAERMGEEAEQLEMSALLATLDVGVRVYQLDRSEGPFAVYILPDERFKGRGELVTLLYRPGHYDLLYKRA